MSRKVCIFADANGEKSVCRKKAHFRLILRCELRHFSESNAKDIVNDDAPIGLYSHLEYFHMWGYSGHQSFCITGSRSPTSKRRDIMDGSTFFRYTICIELCKINNTKNIKLCLVFSLVI